MDDAKELRRRAILTKPIFPLLIKMSIPTIIGMLVSVIYNVTDTFFVGRLHNRSMIAAIGVVFSFVSIIQAIGFWYGYGSGNVMSKKIGEQDYADHNRHHHCNNRKYFYRTAFTPDRRQRFARCADLYRAVFAHHYHQYSVQPVCSNGV